MSTFFLWVILFCRYNWRCCLFPYRVNSSRLCFLFSPAACSKRNSRYCFIFLYRKKQPRRCLILSLQTVRRERASGAFFFFTGETAGALLSYTYPTNCWKWKSQRRFLFLHRPHVSPGSEWQRYRRRRLGWWRWLWWWRWWRWWRCRAAPVQSMGLSDASKTLPHVARITAYRVTVIITIRTCLYIYDNLHEQWLCM